MDKCHKYIGIVNPSADWNKGYLASLNDILKIIDDNQIEDVNKLKDILEFTILRLNQC